MRLTQKTESYFNSPMSEAGVQNLHIRSYRDPDWPQICAIHDEARKIELGAANLLAAGAFVPLEKCAVAEDFFTNTIIVATSDDTIVGFAAYEPQELTWLYVAPPHFGKGIGQHLIRHILDATERPLEVEMLGGNQRAQRLYEYMGFKLVKRTEGKLQGLKPVPATGFTFRLD